MLPYPIILINGKSIPPLSHHVLHRLLITDRLMVRVMGQGHGSWVMGHGSLLEPRNEI